MPHGRQESVSEMKRILRPNGRAYLAAGAPPFGYVDNIEWEIILKEFLVERGGSKKERWAVVSQQTTDISEQ